MPATTQPATAPGASADFSIRILSEYKAEELEQLYEALLSSKYSGDTSTWCYRIRDAWKEAREREAEEALFV